MQRKTENRMGKQKWCKMLSDLQQRVRCAKRIGPEARKDLTRPIPSANSSTWPSASVQLDWKKHVEIDPRYYRPAEVDLLIGDYGKARRQLLRAQTKFADLVRLMVDADVKLLKDHREGRIKVDGLICRPPPLSAC